MLLLLLLVSYPLHVYQALSLPDTTGCARLLRQRHLRRRLRAVGHRTVEFFHVFRIAIQMFFRSDILHS